MIQIQCLKLLDLEAHIHEEVEEISHETLKGWGLLKNHRLSETPIVWGNTSLGVARYIWMRLFESQYL